MIDKDTTEAMAKARARTASAGDWLGERWIAECAEGLLIERTLADLRRALPAWDIHAVRAYAGCDRVFEGREGDRVVRIYQDADSETRWYALESRIGETGRCWALDDWIDKEKATNKDTAHRWARIGDGVDRGLCAIFVCRRCGMIRGEESERCAEEESER